MSERSRSPRPARALSLLLLLGRGRLQRRPVASRRLDRHIAFGIDVASGIEIDLLQPDPDPPPGDRQDSSSRAIAVSAPTGPRFTRDLDLAVATTEDAGANLVGTRIADSTAVAI